MDPVSFNVGGKIFQVSRYLLKKHSETMLGTAASSGYSSPEPIFLDGDAAIFAQVLIYLRHGNITLPVTISKDMFIKELVYYDVAIGPGSVKSESEGRFMLIENQTRVLEKINENLSVLSKFDPCFQKIIKNLSVLSTFDQCYGSQFYSGYSEEGMGKLADDIHRKLHEHTK
ncbi:hypothetical protein THAOC_33501 [Thalassiosira oceanica]|uniref:Potassium channel tetramerisation-type BTB domain-containing protein n=1 Tax=Thalassiosira oceanica TaxID=159749 RepID=K0RM21_THAOC|nr:hypothetical protein THAOC_33501 [Thalassiosira oceanica]|eukprot:EJK47762.1 hypothetical protein THAOC_33501 [Thalassiosira oceanica]